MSDDATLRERALRLTDERSEDGTAELLHMSREERVALAWAVLDEALVAWTPDPSRTQRCAAVLAEWHRRQPDDEVAAAADWCEGIATIARGEMESAIAALDRACCKLETLGQLQRAAQTQIPKVMALAMLGRHDAALACGEQTRERLLACGDDLGAGRVELNLGSMLLRCERYERAAERYRQAAVRFARAGDRLRSVMADIGLAGALTWLFRFDEALQLYDRAAMRSRAHDLSSLQGTIDTNRGRLELHRGRFEAALRAFEAALREAERDGLPHDVAEAQRDLADAYLALNLLPEAIALYGRTITASEALGAPVERAWAQVQCSLAHTRQGDAIAAAHCLAAAREVFVQADLPVGAALADLRQAALELALGRAEPALRRADGATAGLRAAGVDGWAHEADLVAADALTALDDVEAARCRYEATLAAASSFPELCAAAYTGRGRLHQRRGDAARAREDYELAVRNIELQRAALPGDEFRTAYGADKQRAYDGLIELAFDSAGPGAAWQLLRSLERARAPALRAALAQAPSSGDSGLDTVRREQLRWLHEQWRQAVSEGDMERAAQLQARTRKLERDWLESQRRQQAARGDHTSCTRDRDALAGFDSDALCAALADDTALACFGQVGSRLAACVATRQRLVHVVTPIQDLVERIEQLRFQIDSLRFGAPALRRHGAQMAQRARAHLQALHSIVWQPVARALEGRPRVVVVPHRNLHYLPWCALDDGHEPLLARHEISVAQSVELWLEGGAPAAFPTRAWRRATVVGVCSPTLPHVAAEVDAVAQAFAAQPGGQATTLRDAAATQPALRDALQSGADVLHLACHGQFRADSPYFSALHLADGPLTVRDAAALPLPAGLVTLSACETGLSRVAPGDEALGLLRGFLLGGARRVLATQWTVDDASTAALMQQFYRGVLGGQAPAAALRAAQLALAQEWPHPYHWAAFTLHERG